ncbi:hypothetical protein MCOR02_007826 [Pyricularia oryzae]|nr:hypothetical protein MCOR02_007826 [Pyricularia oryzae]KAI6320549.1 hypothetical protein MCOR29_005283 [Pyricularia oryzae]KAI6471147.1 hypothetical protein MCOR15_001035 [Pyricularia oryzae]KAI6493218.1 hypothetical protein MCOR11_006300 [Pyricularia oryzae]KAI6497744.1 hypothetical protein MCOR13_006694 [Pyricularia oryzae]
MSNQSPSRTKANPPHLSRVHAAAIDGRVRNPIFRRTQLKRLHDAVASNSDALERAILADALLPSCITPADARLELCLALRAVRELAAALDVKAAFAEEYSVASSKDAAQARRPVGIVVVTPAAHTPVYSAVAAVAAAVAGGNCVILQLDNTLQEIPSALRKALHNAVDHDAVALATSDEISTASFGDTQVIHYVQQTHQQRQQSPTGTEHTTRFNQLLVCPNTDRTIAIVERDADVDAAASALVGARFALGGTSPYAPDVVLVNEWVEKDFLQAVLRHTATVVSSRATAASPSSGKTTRSSAADPSLLDRVREEGKARVVSTGDLGTVLTVEARDSFLLSSSAPKVTQPVLAIHSVTSMDDAIDASGRDLLAAYVFTKNPANAKYVTQFLDSAAAYVNHVPPRLLVGPAAARGYPIDPESAAPSTDMFTVPRPVYVGKRGRDVGGDKVLSKVVGGGDASAAVMAEMARDLGREMPALARPLNQVGINFFEQGILTGAVLFFGTILTGVGFAGYHGYRLFASR